MLQSTIYIVQKTEQMYDGDGWDHWIVYNPISYHSTQENAGKKIIDLLNDEMVMLEAHKLRNPHIEDWSKQTGMLQNNLVEVTEGTGRYCEVVQLPIYSVKAVNLLD